MLASGARKISDQSRALPSSPTTPPSPRRFLTPVGRSKSRGFTFHQCPQSRAPKFSPRAARAFLTAVEGIAEHPGQDRSAAKEMHLKAVRLLFGARFGVD